MERCNSGNTRNTNIKTQALALTLSAIFLTACGGGGSSSGAPSQPVAPPTPVVSDIPDGSFTGMRSTVFSGTNINETPQDSSYTIRVTGTIVGQQRVEIRFRQWSGTSAIVVPGNTFSIPSGDYKIGAPDSFGNCLANKVVEGTFNGTEATGTETGSVSCDIRTAPISIDATFSVSHSGAAKLVSSEINSTPSIKLER